LAHSIFQSPIGPLLVETTSRGVRQITFLDDNPLTPVEDATDDTAALDLLDEAMRQVEAYFDAGQPLDLPLDLVGTPFRRRVWDAIAQVPFGQTSTYSDIAAAVGAPAAYRAAGSACGANPAVLIVPCHRVIGRDGGLHGFGGGMYRKVWLLAHEKRWAGEADLQPDLPWPPAPSVRLPAEAFSA
jgi:methylated-DNA-[protein]-cysteine S-methyltransferase